MIVNCSIGGHYLILTLKRYILSWYTRGKVLVFLPINEVYFPSNTKGDLFKVEILVEESTDLEKYPEGVKAIFKMFSMASDGESKLVVLLDNHKPYGFHYHDQLPSEHDSRIQISTELWSEAWNELEKLCKEILNES